MRSAPSPRLRPLLLAPLLMLALVVPPAGCGEAVEEVAEPRPEEATEEVAEALTEVLHAAVENDLDGALPWLDVGGFRHHRDPDQPASLADLSEAAYEPLEEAAFDDVRRIALDTQLDSLADVEAAVYEAEIAFGPETGTATATVPVRDDTGDREAVYDVRLTRFAGIWKVSWIEEVLDDRDG